MLQFLSMEVMVETSCVGEGGDPAAAPSGVVGIVQFNVFVGTINSFIRVSFKVRFTT